MKIVNEKIVKAVDKIVNMPEAHDGYIDVLKGLSVLMGNNLNPSSQTAAKLVESLAVLLDDYLSEPEEDEDEESNE